MGGWWCITPHDMVQRAQKTVPVVTKFCVYLTITARLYISARPCAVIGGIPSSRHCHPAPLGRIRLVQCTVRDFKNEVLLEGRECQRGPFEGSQAAGSGGPQWTINRWPLNIYSTRALAGRLQLGVQQEFGGLF